MQLPPEKRVRMYEVLTELDIGTTTVTPTEPEAPAEPEPAEPATQPQTAPAPATPADMLAEADAVAADNPSRARALYRAVIQQDRRRSAADHRRSATRTRQPPGRGTSHRRQETDRPGPERSGSRRREVGPRETAKRQGQRRRARLVRRAAFGNNSRRDRRGHDGGDRRRRPDRARNNGRGGRRRQNPNRRPIPTADHLAGIAEQLSFESGGEVPLESQPSSDLIVAVRKAQAQKEAAKGERASDAGQHALAAEHYQTARRLDPDNGGDRRRGEPGPVQGRPRAGAPRCAPRRRPQTRQILGPAGHGRVQPVDERGRDPASGAAVRRGA